MHLVQTLLRTNWRDRLLFFETVGLSLLAWSAIHILPFRIVAGWIGRQQEATAVEPEGTTDQKLIRRVRWAVEATSRRVPWKCKCLAQAMIARSMLGRRGVSGTVHFGLTKSSASLEGHAWLQTGDTTVTGRVGLHNYTTMTKFAFGASRAAILNRTESR